MTDEQHIPERQVDELVAQLGLHGRPMMFLLGAGTSMAAGLPGMDKLTKKVFDRLAEGPAEHFRAVQKACGGGNVEIVLNHLRVALRDRPSTVARSIASPSDSVSTSCCGRGVGLLRELQAATVHRLRELRSRAPHTPLGPDVPTALVSPNTLMATLSHA